MINLKTVLKMLDIKIDEEHIKAVEDIIPKIPGKANELIQYIAGNTKRFHERLDTIDQRLARLEQQNGRSDNAPSNGTGGNALAEHTTNHGTE